MKTFNCPICSSELIKTGYRNIIFNAENYYCSNCHSYHIMSYFDFSDYYAKQYHDDFSFVKAKKHYKLFCGFQNSRAYSRCRFFRKHTQKQRFDNFLEIGGGNGQNFLVFDLFNKPKSYIIVEPNIKFNINKPNLRYYNNLFENTEDSSLGKVDLIMLFHVLEHIYDVNSFLERVRK
ncbi:MAG: class I SAM-dependent methyltransferase [Bacteroidetes bacterium]|nr:class I SAM-dependent methyltransferase [Bacteroidota bacterium]